MKEVTPLKRSATLQPLSREHHDALLFVWKLRQGQKHHASPVKLRKFSNWFWKNHLRPHFFQEEKFLLPHVPNAGELFHRMKAEHIEILELMIAIERENDAHDISALCNLIERHIRWEEKEFFSYLEEHLSPEECKVLLANLEKYPVNCTEEWSDEFWKIAG